MPEREAPPKPVTHGTHKTHSSMDEMELAGHALAHGPVKGVSGKAGQHNKPLRHMHIKELHDGTYHVVKGITNHGPNPTGAIPQDEEGSAPSVDHIHDHVEEHFGTPNDEERAEHDAGTGEKAGGTDETTESKPDGGQGQTGSHKEA